MIDELKVSVLFRGENFSPNYAEKITGLKLSDKLEVGDITKKRIHKGKPLTFGSGPLHTPDDIPNDERVMWIVNALEGKLETFYECGAEKTRIYAGYFYKHQCNFSFSKEDFQGIAKLNIDFWVSCYDRSDDED
jgi:hypothetical protein